MKRYIFRKLLIARLTALALLTICFAQPPLSAHASATAAGPLPSPISDHRDGILISNAPSIGFVFGQTLRMTVAHVSMDSGEDQPRPDVRVGAWILDATGQVIAQSAEVQIPRNEFRSFDFDRAALALLGEPGTGRLQVSVRLVMHVADPYGFTDDPKASGLLLPSLELIDNNTGRTAVLMPVSNNLKQIGLALHVCGSCASR